MVDLGEGAKGLRIRYDEDRPDGHGPTVAGADDAWLLLALTVWPRMVALADDCDLVPVMRCHTRGDDLAGSVRLTLARRDGAQQTFLGAGEVCVLGELPSRWWGWRTRDGAPVLHRERTAVEGSEPAESLLTYDGISRTRKVLLLGGPQDGDELTTDCLEIECPAVPIGTKWHRPRDVDDPELAAVMTRHVFYRVRRVTELDRTGPWWDGERLEGHEWVATFEGERPLEEGGWPPAGWVDIGTTTELTRPEVLAERALAELVGRPGGMPSTTEMARVALDAVTNHGWSLVEDADLEQMDPGGEADPDDVLVAIVDGMDRTGYPGPLDAASRCGGLVESALDVRRVLLARFAVHPRPTA